MPKGLALLGQTDHVPKQTFSGIVTVRQPRGKGPRTKKQLAKRKARAKERMSFEQGRR